MTRLRFTFQTFTLLAITVACASLAEAQATRTWVSGVGDDVNPCSRTAPCKTFAGAISKTARNGEISTLDPGGFGTITITKSITINGTHGQGYGSILASLTTGVNINITDAADTFKTVRLRALDINGSSNGINGIRVLGTTLAGTKVHVEDTIIDGFTNRGITFEANNGGNLYVSDTIVRNCAQTGIVILPSTGAVTINAMLNNVQIYGSGHAALSASNGSRVFVRDSVAAGNVNFGFFAEGPAGASQLNLENCVSFNNGTGVTASTGGTVRISNVTTTKNGTGLQLSGGSILSYGNNHNQGNTTAGSITGTVPAPNPI